MSPAWRERCVRAVPEFVVGMAVAVVLQQSATDGQATVGVYIVGVAAIGATTCLSSIFRAAGWTRSGPLLAASIACLPLISWAYWRTLDLLSELRPSPWTNPSRWHDFACEPVGVCLVILTFGNGAWAAGFVSCASKRASILLAGVVAFVSGALVILASMFSLALPVAVVLSWLLAAVGLLGVTKVWDSRAASANACACALTMGAFATSMLLIADRPSDGVGGPVGEWWRANGVAMHIGVTTLVGIALGLRGRNDETACTIPAIATPWLALAVVLSGSSAVAASLSGQLAQAGRLGEDLIVVEGPFAAGPPDLWLAQGGLFATTLAGPAGAHATWVKIKMDDRDGLEQFWRSWRVRHPNESHWTPTLAVDFGAPRAGFAMVVAALHQIGIGEFQLVGRVASNRVGSSTLRQRCRGYLTSRTLRIRAREQRSQCDRTMRVVCLGTEEPLTPVGTAPWLSAVGRTAHFVSVCGGCNQP